MLACNSATSVALEAATQRYDLPVIGVIEPTARLVVPGRLPEIGVIGTEATIGSGAYSRAIRSFNPSAEVVERACPRLAGLVEDGQIDTVRTALTLAADLMPLRRPPWTSWSWAVPTTPFSGDPSRGSSARRFGWWRAARPSWQPSPP